MRRLLCVYSNLFIFLFLVDSMQALPLSTSSRWIVDNKGKRVKLACVNWVAHADLVVAEGLSKQSVDEISRMIKEMKFNCVRLTWPLYLATDRSLASLTVRQSFRNAGLSNFIPGIKAHNPSILDRSLIHAFQAVVASLTKKKVMVILDNHVSRPGWCCGNIFDGNGFFGDMDFDPSLWVYGLTRMATLFKHDPYVVGLSLRNELRGFRQNVQDWYRYMQQGAEAVHNANPHLLVIISGLDYDKDFTFLKENPISLSFKRKLVYETHWYSFSDGHDWENGNPNEVCGNVKKEIMRLSGFLLDLGFPLFVSEWGVDLREIETNDNRYLNCFLAWMAQHDVDWALWTLVGSYYIREGITEVNEYYGVLNWEWTKFRSKSFLDRISLIQYPLQGPRLSNDNTHSHKMIYHPSTGLCIKRNQVKGVHLGNCLDSNNHWIHTHKNTLTISGSNLCLKAQRLDHPVKLSHDCRGTGKTRWELISDSKLHFSVSLRKGEYGCLDVDYVRKKVITRACKCLSEDHLCNPESQWFKIIDVSVESDTNFTDTLTNSSLASVVPSFGRM